MVKLNNKCLNSCLWKKLPKDVFMGTTILEIRWTIINFNNGANDFKHNNENWPCWTNEYCFNVNKTQLKGYEGSLIIIKIFQMKDT